MNDRGFLLDTNVVSELVRATPHARVLAWIRRQRPSDLFLAAVTLGEIVRGVVRLPTGSRRSRLEAWVTESLPRQFAGWILAFDQQTVVIWGELMGTADRAGRPRASTDAQIAATAIRHDLILVTRNTGDFEDLISAIDCWRLPGRLRLQADLEAAYSKSAPPAVAVATAGAARWWLARPQGL